MPCMSPSKYPALFAVKSEPWRSRKWKKRQRQRRGEKLAAAPFNDQKYEAARARKEAAQASRKLGNVAIAEMHPYLNPRDWTSSSDIRGCLETVRELVIRWKCDGALIFATNIQMFEALRQGLCADKHLSSLAFRDGAIVRLIV